MRLRLKIVKNRKTLKFLELAINLGFHKPKLILLEITLSFLFSLSSLPLPFPLSLKHLSAKLFPTPLVTASHLSDHSGSPLHRRSSLPPNRAPVLSHCREGPFFFFFSFTHFQSSTMAQANMQGHLWPPLSP